MQPVPRTAPPTPDRQPLPAPAAQWWRFGIVWLVIGGPAAVVFAGCVTMALAWTHADTVLAQAPAPAVATAAPARAHAAAAPAMQARNHLATPPR